MAPDTRSGLLETIQNRRRAIDAYVQEKNPPSNRLLTVTIVSSSLAAALTAGPGFGGPDFTDTVQDGLALERSQNVWQVLCLAAVAVSLTAAISAQLSKAHDLRARIGAAEAAGVMLEGLQTRLQYGRLSVQDAAQEYQDILTGIPFVHEPPSGDQPRGDDTAAPVRRRLPTAWWAAAVVILASLLLVAALVGYVLGLAGSSTASGGTGPAPSVPASPSSSPAPAVDQAVFAGRTEDDQASIALVTSRGRAAAYLCDGRQVEAWLEGPVVGDNLALTAPNGSALTGSISNEAVSGTVTAPGLSTSFTAEAAATPAGFYTAKIEVGGTETRIRWVVLPDGSQVGVRRPGRTEGTAGDEPAGETPAPAPELDTETTTFMLAGRAYPAQRVDPRPPASSDRTQEHAERTGSTRSAGSAGRCR